MTDAVMVVIWVLAALFAGQAILVAGFVGKVLQFKQPTLKVEACPRAVIILCLRGPDPSLTDCLRGVLGQNYPNYEVRIVVDHKEDPAWLIAEQVLTEVGADHAQLMALENPAETCSLKCSSVVQAVQAIGDDCEIVALLDADTVPHASWLRELTAPFADGNVGATTGNRWYMPHRPSPGAMIRYFWNAAAIVQMYWFRIPWGGTLALRRSLFDETDLLDRWSHAFCEDTMLFGVLKETGRRVEFVPSLMMVNREDCTIGGYFRWVRRQLLTARLYHPRWPLVVGHGVSTIVTAAASILVIVWALLAGEPNMAIVAGMALLVYYLGLTLLLAPMETGVRRIVRHRGEPAGWLSPVVILGSIFYVPLTQAVYAAALCSAIFLRDVDWRGVHYRVEGPRSVRLLEYRPFRSEVREEESSLSL